MNLDEFYLLQRPEVQDLLDKSDGMDPSKFALQLQKSEFPAAALATQLKYRERGKEKLPHWVAAKCLFEQQAFEQCTSEQLALAKPWGKGERALDLTCGLGVDAWAMAQHFEEVTTLEPDRLRFILARHNLEKLGAENITVWQSDAAAWLRSCKDDHFDLIYVDPDRRDQTGSKVFRFQDCAPDVLAMQDELVRLGSRVLIKTSPMLDVNAALAELRHVAVLTVLAGEGECKELLFELRISHDPAEPASRGVCFLRKGVLHRWEGKPGKQEFQPVINGNPAFIYEADVSLYKAQMVAEWFAAHYSGQGELVHPEGYFFSDAHFPEFPGRSYQVIEAMPWKPDLVKKYLKGKGIKQVNLTRRYFDLPFDQIRKQLTVSEGGTDYLVFTRTWDGQAWVRMCFHAKRSDLSE